MSGHPPTAFPVPGALLEYARLAEPRLAAFLDEKGARLAGLPVDLRSVHGALREYVLRGGKRLRGALVLLGHEAAGGTAAAAFLPSLGVELLHAYLLIHDDFMDQDAVRRGGPTLHVALAAEAPGPRGAHLGASLAVLAGSLCEAWAIELVLSAEVAAERCRAAAQHLARALAEVTLGQMMDLAAPSGPPLDASDVLELQRLKTASYSFDLPLQLGALLAGGASRLLRSLASFALPLGQAFQIADDLLGALGTPALTGKSSSNDLREGKRTILIARALEMASAADAERLRAALGRQDLGDAEAAELQAILRLSGAADAARAEAERLCAQALAALESAEIPQGVAAVLREIALYSVRRNL